MRNVLLPIDSSDSAFQAAMYVADFIKKHGPLVIHVLYVQPRPLKWQSHGSLVHGHDDQMSVAAHIALRPVLHALHKKGVTYQTHIRFGDVSKTLVAMAEELGCDHIIMGEHGRGALSGRVMSAVTRKVLHLAKIPVICVKSSWSCR